MFYSLPNFQVLELITLSTFCHIQMQQSLMKKETSKRDQTTSHNFVKFTTVRLEHIHGIKAHL